MLHVTTSMLMRTPSHSAWHSRPEIMAEFLEKHRDYGVKVTLSQEIEPLGTAGPLALAQELLDDGEPFFVLNCDIACEFSLRSMLDFHRAVGTRGRGRTLCLL